MTSQYLERLARSDPLDAWKPGELTEALATVENLVALSRQPAGEPRVLNLRLAIYRRRLRYELAQRADRDEDAGEP
ncbi:hypothetical protein ACXC9Q_06890 [Kribbella sp. CWNU-51]